MSTWSFESTTMQNASHTAMLNLFKEKIIKALPDAIIEDVGKGLDNGSEYRVLFARLRSESTVVGIHKVIACFAYPKDVSRSKINYRTKFFLPEQMSHKYHKIFSAVPHNILEGVTFGINPLNTIANADAYMSFKKWYHQACTLSEYISPTTEGSAIIGTAKTGCYLISKSFLSTSSGEHAMVFYVQNSKNQDYRDQPDGNVKYTISRQFIKDNLICVSPKDLEKLLKKVSKATRSEYTSDFPMFAC